MTGLAGVRLARSLNRVTLREGPANRPRILAEAALAVVFATALAGQAVAIATTWGGGYWLFGLCTGLVVCVLALFRRRHRGGLAAAGLVVAAAAILAARFAQLPAEPSPAMTLGLSVLVGSAIRALPARWAGAVAAGGLAVVVGSRLGAHSSSSGATAVATLNGLGWLAAVAIGLGLRVVAARRRAVAEQVRRDERLALARELHDVVAHHITGIVLQAQAAQLVARKQPERLDGSLAAIEEAGSDALAAMRRVVGLLRDADDAAPARPGPEQLSELVDRFDGHGPTVRLCLPDGVASVWPPEVTSTVYRVVQESLTNVSRHAAHARSVEVNVFQDRRGVTVEVVDDAPLIPRYQHRGGYGLVGMRERVEALGGTLCAGPRSEGGWSVRATLPTPARESR